MINAIKTEINALVTQKAINSLFMRCPAKRAEYQDKVLLNVKSFDPLLLAT